MKSLLAAILVLMGAASVNWLAGVDRLDPSVQVRQPALLTADIREHHDVTGTPPTMVPLPRALTHGGPAETAAAGRLHLPDLVVISQLTEYYSAVVFDHSIHVRMSEITGGCTNCHHNSVVDEPVAACRECHPIQRDGQSLTQPSLRGAYHRQCLGCHRDWSHENGCGYCHQEQTPPAHTADMTDPTDIVMTPSHPRIEPSRSYFYQTGYTLAPVVSFYHDGHAREYGLKCVDCHRESSCARCHDGSTTTQEPAIEMSSCTACHATNDCNFCHTRQARPEFSHSAVAGWSLDPQHADVACISCHGRVEMFIKPSSNCRGCHSGLSPTNFDHRITGVPLLGSHARFECSRCHVDNRSDTPATCNGCHAQKHYPFDLPGQRQVVR